MSFGTLRALGAFNGTLPEPTGILIGFLRDPQRMPFLRYTQMIPAPEISFMYAQMDPDEAVRLVNTNEFAWAYDDYRPTGKGSFQPRINWATETTQRWDFPYTLGEHTIRVWKQHQKIDPRQVFDRMRSNHAALHRAVRVVSALANTSWGANSAILNTLMGTSGAYFDKSSGQQYLPDGTDNPNFQVIKKVLQRVKRRLHLGTNGALTGEELCMVMPPIVAEAVAASGEIVEFLKQSQYAKELTDPNIRDWNLPTHYAGFKLVVEDTPRCFINAKADGTVADVTVSAQKDYILNTDTCYFVSRPGGLDGAYGGLNYSTIQCYHYNGEARIEAFSEPKHELVEGHVVMEDKIVSAVPYSGFQLTDVLST